MTVNRSATYQKNRLRALVRDNFTCQFPGCRVGRLNRLTAHHITPVCDGGTHELDNLATLCLEHHNLIHQTDKVKEFEQLWESRRGSWQLLGEA